MTAEDGRADRLAEAAGRHLRDGRLGEAAALLSEACSTAPWRDDLAVALGEVLARQGRAGLALRAFDLAAEVNPANGRALLAAGHILRAHHDYDAALGRYLRASLAAPGDHAPVLAAARTLADQGRIDEARSAFDRALALGAPTSVRWRKATLLPVVATARPEIAAARERLWRELDGIAADPPPVDDPVAETDGAPFLLAYHGEDDRAIMERLAALYRLSCPALDWTAPHCRAPRRPGPPRVAVISHGLHAHSVGRYFVRLVEGLAAAGARVHLFTPPAPADDIRSRYEAAAAAVIPSGDDLWALRRKVAAAEPDIALFIDQGFNPLTYFLAFARLAPVQCTVLGHPVTSGLPTIDFFLSCAAAEPSGAQVFYTERLIALPGQPTAYIRPPAPPARARRDFGLPEGGRLYLMAQNLFKLHPDMDACLGEIVERDPEARLAVVAGHDAAWTAAAAGRLRPHCGDRLSVVERQPHDEFVALLAIADVCLDSFHFSGANTTFQALSVGTPVVTLPGAHVRGRQSMAILELAGLGELVAEDPSDYAARAVGAARDQGLRRRILDAAGRIFDDPRPTEAAVNLLMEAAVRG